MRRNGALAALTPVSDGPYWHIVAVIAPGDRTGMGFPACGAPSAGSSAGQRAAWALSDGPLAWLEGTVVPHAEHISDAATAMVAAQRELRFVVRTAVATPPLLPVASLVACRL
jgi:hypothetical protein